MTSGSPPPLGPPPRTDPTARFLLDAWAALLEPESPDLFRARYCDISALLIELEELAQRAIVNNIWLKHVEAVKAELDFICEHHEKTWLASKPDLQYWLTTAIKPVVRADLAEIRRMATLALQAFGEPSTTWPADLRRLIAQTPPDHAALYNRLGTIASQLERQNFDRDRLLAAAAVTPTRLASAEAAANSILQATASAESPYTCFLGVREATEGDLFSLIKNTGIRLVSTKELTTHGHLEYLNAAGTGAFVAVSINERGFRLAAAAAYRLLSWHTDILNFYSHHDALEIAEVALVVDVTGEKQLIPLAESHKRRPRKARRKLARVTVESPHAEVSNGRIRAALEQYSIAVRAQDSAVALSTLWTGLETLIGQHGPDAIHDRVIHWVAPIFAWRSVGQWLTYLGIHLHEIGVGGPDVPMTPGLPHSNPRGVHIEDAATLLCRPDTDPLVSQVLTITAQHPLLHFQYRKFREILTDPKGRLASHLENIRKNVEWTILRAYRARNLTVHYGQRSALEARLYEHLHEYFSVIASTLLAALRENPGWDAEVAMESARQRYFHLLHMLRKQPNVVSLADLSNSSSQAPLWPVPAPPAQPAAAPPAAPAP